VPDPVNVIVVGAGPGGATAALTLARAGVRVRIVDRAHFPRAKPCGGAVSVRALSRFPYLAEALGEISVHRVSRLDLESPRGAVARLASDGPAALMIRRVEFDALLLSLALRAGATISQGVEVTGIRDLGTRVELTTRRGALSAAAVIAADGVNSVVARRLGLRRTSCGAPIRTRSGCRTGTGTRMATPTCSRSGRTSTLASVTCSTIGADGGPAHRSSCSGGWSRGSTGAGGSWAMRVARASLRTCCRSAGPCAGRLPAG
jgi:2-polyprenyl-6-methoxyphenol hydroxylase-like FAD-dependent oxidoreductase